MLLFSSMCVRAYTGYCSQACVYMSMQLCISTKALKNSNISGNWDLFLMTLGQWWGLQELVSRCAGQLICSELDHIDCHAPTMSNSQKEMSLQLVTLLHLQHSLASSPTIYISQQLRHTKLWKKVPKLNLMFKKLNTK